jgi:carbamoyl-phosphate synthase large subunit
MSADITVIVTGAGAPGTRGTVYALREGARQHGVSLRLIGVDQNPAVAARGFCDIVRPVPSPLAQDYGERIAEVCREEGAQVVLPQTTREIEWLSSHTIPAETVKVVVNTKSAMMLANSKTETARIFQELGLGAPRFFATRNSADFLQACESLGYPNQPVVVKLPVSNGMRGLRILRKNAWDFRRFVAEKPSGTECSLEEMLSILNSAAVWPELMVSEYLDGDEYSVDCYSGRAGEIAIPRKRDVIRSGISFITTIERDEDMMHACSEASRRIGLCGVFGFQFKKTGGKPKVLECNPRVQGTMVASLLTGNNLIWAAVADALSDILPPVELNHAWTSGRCYRYWGAVLEAPGFSELRVV